MNWLLLPDDEAPLVDFITHDLSLELVAGHDWERDGLPRRNGPQPSEIVWWASAVGPICRLGDAPEPTDPNDVVAMRLNREANPEGWRDDLDTSGTLVIRFHRSSWNENGCLNPGRLQAMSILVKDHPAALLDLHRQIGRWLKSDGKKVNPFRHTIETPVPEPKRLGALTAWARPHALAWIRNGGKVWPWNG